MNRIPCIICSRPDREAIEHDIARGASLREVGRAYGIHHTAVFRHKRDHTPNEIAALSGAHKRQDRGTALARLEALYTTAEKLLKKALKDSTSVNGQVQVVKEVRSCLELIARGPHLGHISVAFRAPGRGLLPRPVPARTRTESYDSSTAPVACVPAPPTRGPFVVSRESGSRLMVVIEGQCAQHYLKLKCVYP